MFISSVFYVLFFILFVLGRGFVRVRRRQICRRMFVNSRPVWLAAGETGLTGCAVRLEQSDVDRAAARLSLWISWIVWPKQAERSDAG